MSASIDVAALLNSHLRKREDLLAALEDRGFSLDNLSLYCWLGPHDVEKGNSEFVGFLASGIEGVSQAQWKVIIQNPDARESRVLKLFDIIALGRPSFRLGLNVEQAISEFLRDVRVGTVSATVQSQAQVQALFDRLGPQQKENLVQNIFDDLEAASAPNPVRLVVTAVRPLLTAEAFSKNELSTRVRRILFPLLSEPEELGLSWIQQLFVDNRNLLSHVIPEVRAGFEERLHAAAAANSSEKVSEILTAIKSLGGIPDLEATPPNEKENS